MVCLTGTRLPHLKLAFSSLGREPMFLVGDGYKSPPSVATLPGSNFKKFWAAIRAHFGAQIPGKKSSPDSGLLQ